MPASERAAKRWQSAKGPARIVMVRAYKYSDAPVIGQHFRVDMARQGIFGHSMGGHGAMTIALKNPDRFKSCSAFAPIVQPSTADWSAPAFEKYLGADQAEAIPPLVKGIIESSDQLRFGRAHFKSFGDSALNYEVVYTVLVADYDTFMNLQQMINLELMRKLGALGIGFAFPTRTIHIAGGARPEEA